MDGAGELRRLVCESGVDEIDRIRARLDERRAEAAVRVLGDVIDLRATNGRPTVLARRPQMSSGKNSAWVRLCTTSLAGLSAGLCLSGEQQRQCGNDKCFRTRDLRSVG